MNSLIRSMGFGRRHAPEIVKIALVHRQYEVEVIDILPGNLARPQLGEVVSAGRSRTLRAGIRRLTDMIPVRTCGIYFNNITQVIVLYIFTQHALCRR